MKILIPMDLSEVSLNALDYAKNRFAGASFTILHVNNGLVNVDYPVEMASGVSLMRARSQMLEEFVSKHLGAKELPDNITCETYFGEPVNVIRNYMKSHIFDCVFIGLRDNYNVLDKLFGTVSLGIVKTSEIPIFVIPRFAQYQEYRRILVAGDEHLSNPDILMAINYWNSNNAQVKFLHVANNKSENFERTKEALIDNYYEKYQPPFSYEVQEVSSDKVADSLLANAYNYKANLLITIARKSSFLQSLVYQSLSKELLLKSAIPVLFLHAS